MGTLNDELNAKGAAQVMVFLKASGVTSLTAAMPRGATVAAGGGVTVTSSELSAHFVSSSRGSALAMAAGRPAPPAGVRYYHNLGIALGTVTKQGLAGLRADKTRVDEVVQAPILRPIRPVRVAAANPPKQTSTWGISAMRVPLLWNKGITGQGVLVGHLDTGVDGTHPAFKNNAIFQFAEFDDMGHQVLPAPAAHDSDDQTPGHGTHTAATIAGRPIKGKHFGVAPDAQLASAMVIEGGDVIARILGGMDWAVGLNVRILSMSLGLPGFDDSFLALTQLLRSKNVLPIFAVGNEGPGTSRSPGNYAEALSVGASDKTKHVADFSSSDTFTRPVDPNVPDLVGPGVDVISAKIGGGFQTMSGTSMATPHLAGLAALLMSGVPGASADQVEQAIFGSCNPLPDDPPVRQGRGLPDAPKALAILQGLAGGTSPAPIVAAAAAKPKRAKKKASAKKKVARK